MDVNESIVSIIDGDYMTNKEYRRRKRNKRKRIAKKQRIIRQLEQSLGMSLKQFRVANDPWRQVPRT